MVAAVGGAAQTSPAALQKEWEEAQQTSAQTEPLSRHVGGVGGAAGLRRVGMLVGQVARVHHTVWEKSGRLTEELQGYTLT